MRIAVLANLKKNAPTWEGMPSDRWSDLDSPKTIQAIIHALEAGGHEAEFFEASIQPPFNLIERLQEYRPDMCFNISEGHFGDGREAQIPGILEMLRIPYTGSQVLTLAIALDKPMTKRVLWYHGLPTAEFQTFERADDPIDAELLNDDGDLRFPLFVKPSREGTGMGVSASSIVRTVAELRERVAEQLERYHQPILCERYIKGREMTVGLIGNLKPPAMHRMNERNMGHDLPEELTFFPPLEVRMDQYDPSEAGLYTNRVKVDLGETFHFDCPAKIDAALEHDLYRLTAGVFRVLGCKDVSRVDFRIDETDGKPYILEINPLPGLQPGWSDLCVESEQVGWTHERLVNTIVALAAERYGLTVPARVVEMA